MNATCIRNLVAEADNSLSALRDHLEGAYHLINEADGDLREELCLYFEALASAIDKIDEASDRLISNTSNL